MVVCCAKDSCISAALLLDNASTICKVCNEDAHTACISDQTGDADLGVLYAIIYYAIIAFTSLYY